MCDGPFLALAGGWEDGPAGRLAAHFRLVRFDPRSSGASDRSVLPKSFEEQVADLGAVIDACANEPVALLGYSHVADSAFAFAGRFPNLVTHLIGYGAPGPYQTQRSVEQREYDSAFDALLLPAVAGDNPFACDPSGRPTAPTRARDSRTVERGVCREHPRRSALGPRPTRAGRRRWRQRSQALSPRRSWKLARIGEAISRPPARRSNRIIPPLQDERWTVPITSCASASRNLNCSFAPWKRMSSAWPRPRPTCC